MSSCLYLHQPLSLLLLLLASLLQAQYIPPGELTAPNGHYVLIGQQLILVCSLNRSLPYTASDIFIEKGNAEFNGTTTRLDEYTVLMNETVTSLRYDGVYLCCAGPELLASVEIQVDYYPEPVRDVRCVMHNWDGAVDLTWDLGVPYRHQDDLSVKLLYGQGSQAVSNCPVQNTTFCSIPEFYSIYISVMVEVTNTPTNVTVRGPLVAFNLLQHVKPSQCEVKLEQCNRSSYSFSLVWSHNKPVRSKVYRLRYTNVQTTNWQEIYIDRTMEDSIVEKEFQEYTIRSLTPNSSYRIRLDTRPLDQIHGNMTGYWSDVDERLITTLESAPLTGPQVTSGSFHQEKCTRGQRKLTIYWKPPPVEDQNGLITEYKLYSEETEEVKVQGTTLRVVVHADCRRDVHLRLYSATEMGWSRNYSHIHIPPAPDVDTIVEVYAVVYETEVKVVWDTRQGQTTQYTVYWCDGDSLRHICTSQIRWQHVGGEQQEVTLPVRSTESTLFGVSASRAGVSHGIHWSKCVVQNIAPTVKPNTPQIYVGSKLTSRRVTWRNSRCVARDNALITDYRLLVTFVNNKKVETHFNDTFSLSISEYTLQGLKLNRNYSFRIQAVSDAGEGPFSDVVYAYIQEDPADTTIIIIGVVLTLMLCTGVVLFLCCKGKQILSYLKKKEPIFLPKMLTPLSSPTHDLLPVKPPAYPCNAPADLSPIDDTATIATKESVLWTNISGSGSGYEKTVSSTWQTSCESENMPNADMEVNENQITLTLPEEKSTLADANTNTQPAQAAPESRDGKHLPEGHVQKQQLTPEGREKIGGERAGGEKADGERAGGERVAVNHSDYISSPSQAVSQDTPSLIALSNSSESDSTCSKSKSTDSSTSYVKVTEQPPGKQEHLQETAPSPAMLQPTNMQTFQPGKSLGTTGYVQVSELNTSKV